MSVKPPLVLDFRELKGGGLYASFSFIRQHYHLFVVMSLEIVAGIAHDIEKKQKIESASYSAIWCLIILEARVIALNLG